MKVHALIHAHLPNYSNVIRHIFIKRYSIYILFTAAEEEAEKETEDDKKPEKDEKKESKKKGMLKVVHSF